ncbi:MAG: lipoyl synthase [Firmicutes bacterium]|nr:lipoyl synthase [Bacillota bacterium]
MKRRKPEWLKVKYRNTDEVIEVRNILRTLSLNTVCEEASCPNLMECFGRKTATFMILGKYCTRNCTFCNVEHNRPQHVDPEEPVKVAEAISKLNLKHVVITSVTRDDLPDGGAEHFAQVITEIKKRDQQVIVEVLISDLKGNVSALAQIIQAKPDIINHNIETVPRLYEAVRPQAIYQRSIQLLYQVKLLEPNMLTKSGIMVGLGETPSEVEDVLADLRQADCDLLTIGQYLAPSKDHHPVVEFVTPETFEKYKRIALDLGFKHVASGPLVRSSYHADQVSSLLNNNQ